jgi:hypothetical protein
VIARRMTRSGSGRAGRRASRRAITCSTIDISYMANDAPRQRRTPPNGNQVYVPALAPRKRSGEKRNGSG